MSGEEYDPQPATTPPECETEPHSPDAAAMDDRVQQVKDQLAGGA